MRWEIQCASQMNLAHRVKKQKVIQNKKTKKQICSEKNGANQESVESVLWEKDSLWWEGFVKKVGFKPRVKCDGVMDGDSSKTMKEDKYSRDKKSLFKMPANS